MTKRRVLGWLGLVALVELVTRAVVYALAPTPAAQLAHLEGSLGGPRPLVVAAVALTLGVAGAVALLTFAAMGVNERWALSDPARRGRAPHLRWGLAARRAVVLWLAGLLVFMSVESYLHWRSGLGFHGLHCLFGPVHVNAIPVCAAAALLLAAGLTAAEHLLAWMRRVVARLATGRPRHRATRPVRLALPTLTAPRDAAPAVLRARPPPPVPAF